MTALLSREAPAPPLPLPPPPPPPPAQEEERARSPVWGRLVPLVPLLLINVLVLGDLNLPLVRPLAALYLLLGLPAHLIWQRTVRTHAQGRVTDAVRLEIVLYSVVGAIGVLIVVGLVLNGLLPLFGIERPLDGAPVTVVVTDLVLAELLRRKRLHLTAPATSFLRTALTGREQVVVALGLLCTALAAIGATRLNNGADGTVTAVMLSIAALTFAVMIAWRSRLRLSVLLAGVYFLALAMLLMTSLRGWDITGHDVQREYYVFQLTEAYGNWDPERFRDAYNACLSLAILPVVLSALTGLSGVIVFKVLFQVFFALCPVMVFLIARRFGSTLVALVATMYFVAFPTFFTDMPFLCRQEIGFLFLGATLLVATNGRWTRRRRIRWALFFSVGLVLSHYSTTYILLALIGFALLGHGALVLGARVHQRVLPRREQRPPPETPVLGGFALGVIALMTVVWTGPVTHTGGHLEDTGISLTKALFGGSSERAAEVSYTLFAPPPPPPAQRLQDFQASTLATTADERAEGRYYPLAVLDRYPATLAPDDALPLTSLGRALSGLGVDVELVNKVIRQGSAYLLQILVCLGLLAVVRGRAWGWRPSREIWLLALASLAVMGLLVVLPALSNEYGVLRMFQQGLFLLAPFLVVGSMQLFSWLRTVWAHRLATGVALAFFVSLVGLVPQALGGYGAQLHLNNAGEYYRLYVIDPQEAAATAWLTGVVASRGGGEVQLGAPDDRYTFTLRYDNPEISVSDIYPALIRPWAYVLLNRNTLVGHRSTASVNGDVLDYVYPVELLDRTKDVLYRSGDVAVYR